MVEKTYIGVVAVLVPIPLC